MDEKQAKIAGEQLIEILNLKVKANGRVDTTWGDKTPTGLALTVERILQGNMPK